MSQRRVRAEGSLVHRGEADVKRGPGVFSLTPPRRVGESCVTVGEARLGGLAVSGIQAAARRGRKARRYGHALG